MKQSALRRIRKAQKVELTSGAKKLADQNPHIDLKGLRGSGKNGRFTLKDIKALL